MEHPWVRPSAAFGLHQKLRGQTNQSGEEEPSEKTDEEPFEDIKEETYEEPNEETDGAYQIMAVEDHDFDHSDDFRQWFLVKWLYDSGRVQYIWEPMEILIQEEYLRHLIQYFEAVVKKFHYIDPETTKIERRRNLARGDDDNIWDDDDVFCEDDDDISDDGDICI